jgi:hypothetical protein
MKFDTGEDLYRTQRLETAVVNDEKVEGKSRFRTRNSVLNVD